MNHFREDEELLGDALKRAFDLPEGEDDRFQELLNRLASRDRTKQAA